MNQFDAEFIWKLIKKDPIAFSQFYENTIDIFYRFIKSTYSISEADTQDILSDFYSKIWWNLENIKIEYRFESFIRTVLRNKVKDFLSAKKIYNFTDIEYSDEDWWTHSFADNLIWDDWDYISILQNDYQYEKIQSAMSSLDFITQQIIFLKYIQWFSFEEVSSELCITNDNVRQKLSRGIKKLKTILDN